MKKIIQQKDNKLPPDWIGGYFWVFAGLLCIMLISIMARDIDRPFIGLHSWGQAHEPWVARTHLKYGLGYTKGLMTWAVGDPPAKNPSRYLDHPQLCLLIDAAFMAVLGIHEWSLRAVNILATVISLLLFLKILRGLMDDKTSLLAGLFFVLFPLIGYFGAGMWLYPLVLLAIWCYLALIGSLKDVPQPKPIYKWGLAAGLFFSLQMSWEGFFFALAVGVHYVVRCIYRRQMPERSLLAILIIAPLSSLFLDFVILAAAHGWDFARLFELYKWRAGPAEVGEHNWGLWFAQLWQHAVTNFSLPVLIITILYLTFGQLFVFSMDTTKTSSRRFPQFWLFLMPGIFQLFILKGCLWKHQTWERPLLLVTSVAAALGIMLLAEIIAKIRPLLAKIITGFLILIITISCAKGLNYYYSITHFSPARVKLFKMLNESIPPDKALLSPLLPIEGLVVNQNVAKGEHYRPEVAWYLDREIVQARTLKEIQDKAANGRFPYYLVPALPEEAPLIKQLLQYYKYEYVPADPGGTNQAPMLPYYLFDLQSKVREE